MTPMKICVLAYYVIEEVSDPAKVVKEHKAFLEKLDSAGRIYVSKEGVNAQLSLAEGDVSPYLDYLKSDPLYKTADVKIHPAAEHAFAKLTVKERDQLCAIDTDVDFSERGDHISAAEWKEKLENRDENTIVIDVRNNYESEVGYFEGAIKPDLESFREFPEFAKALREKFNPETTTVLMYCTGGIRCEYYSPIMKKEGFKKVYQLNGGVIRYGIEEGNHLWHGKLFVFDDRLVVDINKLKNDDIGHCHDCGCQTSKYYNCANMDCNKLFLSCQKCASTNHGCCSYKCLETGRVRKFDESKDPKPFRKLPFEEKVRINNQSK